MPETPENTSVVRHTSGFGKRDVDTVPFVEMYQGRLQGVVSASSDVNRVYCAFIEAGSGNYYSSTNNNRPDAGLPKRLGWLCDEAVAQFGLERVVRFLGVEDNKGLTSGQMVAYAMQRKGRQTPQQAAEVFSRFLSYLRHVDLKSEPGPVPEMAWFVGP
jgi:hypothetical protein